MQNNLENSNSDGLIYLLIRNNLRCYLFNFDDSVVDGSLFVVV